jgi:hypothetical protein
MAMEDLTASGYSGQFGSLLVDGAPDPGHYDHEVNLAIHRFIRSSITCPGGPLRTAIELVCTKFLKTRNAQRSAEFID